MEGSQALFSRRTFVYGLPLTAVYLGAQATTLFVVGQVVIAPTEPWNWMVATTAFAFSLVIVLLVPFLPHVGSVEVSGLGVLLTFGISRSHAVASFLAVRVLSTGAIMPVWADPAGFASESGRDLSPPLAQAGTSNNKRS